MNQIEIEVKKLKEWYHKLDSRERKEMILVCGVLLFLLTLLICAGNPARDFLGTWRCDWRRHSSWWWPRYEVFVFKEGTHQPKPVIKLGKKEARLLLAVEWCGNEFSSCSHCGIYEIDSDGFVLLGSDTRSPYRDAFKVRKKGRNLQWTMYQETLDGTCSYISEENCYITCSPE